MAGVRSLVAVMAALAAALLTAATGCGDDGLTCGDGTREEGGRCVASCGAGTVLDPGTGACVPDGSVICPQGTRFVDGRCELDPSACAAGTVLVDGHCVPEGEDIDVDLEEAAEPNDEATAPAGRLTLADDSVVLHGCVVPRVDGDANGNLDPDRDVWLVTTDAPAVLDVTADGVHGLVAGFAVIQADPALATPLRTWQRFGIDLTSDTAARQVYLPAAGTYGLVMTDARSLLLAGTGAGGDGACYYATVRRRPLPAENAFTLPQTAAEDRGDVQRFGYRSPSNGRVLRLTVNTSSTAMVPAFIVLRSGEPAMVAAVRGNRASYTIGGLDQDATVTIVADMEYDWGLTPQAFTFDLVDIAAQPLPMNGSVTLTKRNGLTPLAPYADYDYFYLDVAGSGTVVGFDVRATSGATPVPIDLAITRRDVLNAADLIALVEPFGPPGRDGFIDEHVRFAQPGRYYLVLQDPTGTSGDSYTITSRWSALPTSPAALGAPTAAAALSPFASAFHSLDLTNPVWLEFGALGSGFPAGAGTARVSLYDLAGSGWLGGTYPAIASAIVNADGSARLGRIALNDTRDYLVRIDAIGAPAAGATVSLDARDREHVDLGVLVPGTPIDRTGMDVVAPGGVRRFVVRGASVANTLSARVTPVAATADLRLRRVDVAEATVGMVIDRAGPGGSETLDGNFLFTPDDWIAFEVENASATPTAIDLHVTSIAAPYQVAVASATWTDACSGPGAAIVGTDLDDELLAPQAFPGGWDVRLFGVPVTHYLIGANGVVFLGGAGLTAPACAEAGCWQNVAIPSAAVPNGFLAPLWDDLDRVRLCTKFDGQRVTIQWTGFEYLATPTVAFQVSFLADGKIELVYGSGAAHTSTFDSATVGLESATGAAGLQLGFDTPLPLAGKRVTVTPPP